jgi:hypothetical protein
MPAICRKLVTERHVITGTPPRTVPSAGTTRQVSTGREGHPLPSASKQNASAVLEGCAGHLPQNRYGTPCYYRDFRRSSFNRTAVLELRRWVSGLRMAALATCKIEAVKVVPTTVLVAMGRGYSNRASRSSRVSPPA